MAPRLDAIGSAQWEAGKDLQKRRRAEPEFGWVREWYFQCWLGKSIDRRFRDLRSLGYVERKYGSQIGYPDQPRTSYWRWIDPHKWPWKEDQP